MRGPRGRRLARFGAAAGACVLLLPVVLAIGYSSGLGPVVRGRVTADGQPLAGATYYLVPDTFAVGTTGSDGRFEIRLPMLDHADQVDVCVVADDGRRTEFGEVLVRPGWFGTTTVEVDLSGRAPWPRVR